MLPIVCIPMIFLGENFYFALSTLIALAIESTLSMLLETLNEIPFLTKEITIIMNLIY